MMSPVAILIAASVLSAALSRVAALGVIAGDAIDFQCVTETRDEVDYLPNFERQNDDGDWSTLFVGVNPRPETDHDRWRVSVDDSSVYHYRLLATTLSDGGHYRCENVNTLHHPLRVVSTELDCGELPLNGLVDSESFRPTCRVEASGPEWTNATEAPLTSQLKWVVGSHFNVEKNLTADSTSGLEATLTENLTLEYHGKNISCILDAIIPAHLERPSCVLGPLNIAFDVRSERVNESLIEDCHSFELLFIANPPPVASLISLEDPSGAVEFVVGPVADGVVVDLRACGLEDSVEATLSYDGVPLQSLTFRVGEKEEKPVDEAESDDSGAAAGGTGAVAGAVVVILGLGIAVGVGFYVWRSRQRKSQEPADDEESGRAEAEKGEEVMMEEREEEKEEGDEKAVEGKEAAEGEKEAAESEDEEAKDVETEKEELLKAKMSVLEDVEGVKMIDDSLNEGKDEIHSDQIEEKVDV